MTDKPKDKTQLFMKSMYMKHRRLFEGLLTNYPLSTGQIDINYRDNHDRLTPLMLAFKVETRKTDKLKTAKRLLKYGADINYQDEGCGRTVLMQLSVSYADDDTYVNFLIENGAKVNLKNTSGETALFHAVRECNSSIVEALIKHGADVNESNSIGVSLIMSSNFWRKKESILILMANDVDINGTNEKLQTVLMKHLEDKNEVGFCERLIDYGADVNAVDINGNTLLDYANSKNAIDLLIKHGAKI